MPLAEVQYYSVCQTCWFAQNMWRNTTRFLSGTPTYSNTHYGTVVHLPHFTNKLASEATPPSLLTVTSKQISFNSLLTWYHLCIPTKKKKHWKWRDVGMACQKVHKVDKSDGKMCKASSIPTSFHKKAKMFSFMLWSKHYFNHNSIPWNSTDSWVIVQVSPSMQPSLDPRSLEFTLLLCPRPSF